MESSKIKKVHALVLPYPAQGHINPMLQFSKRLVSKGVQTTFVNTVFVSKSMPSDPKSSIKFETISDGYDEGGFSAAESDEVYVEKLKEASSRTLAQLIKKLQDNGKLVDVVIFDSFLTWTLDVVKPFGVATAAFLTQTCAVNSILYHISEGILPIPLPDDSPVSLPGMPLLQPQEAPTFVNERGHNLAYPAFYDMVTTQFRNLNQTDWVFCNIFDKLEEDVLNWMNKLWRVKAIGPTVPSMYLDKRLEDDTGYGINLFKPDSSVCINWLNSQEKGSVVYVSFGSWSSVSEQQMEELASALKESGFKFLWVVRASEMEKLPKNFIEETWDKGLVVTWSPQLEVLAHESVACFITHSGLSSVLETLSLGVPVVATPVWADQPTNAKYLEDVWGVGLRATPDEEGLIKKEKLVSCLKEIMEGEKGKQIKENSAKWKNLAKEAVDEGGSSDKNIDEFIAELSAAQICCYKMQQSKAVASKMLA